MNEYETLKLYYMFFGGVGGGGWGKMQKFRTKFSDQKECWSAGTNRKELH